MKILKNKTWAEVTREERVFAEELFRQIKNNPQPFFSLLGKEGNNYDIGFEVCFFRDVLKLHGKSIKAEQLPLKRTFDLMLLSENELLIIEAKAQQGFSREQLNDFLSDKENITKLYQTLNIPVPKVEMYALYSSKYRPMDETKKVFTKCITWSDISESYKSAHGIFNRANDLYE